MRRLVRARFLAFSLVLCVPLVAAGTEPERPAAPANRERSFDENWRFHRGDADGADQAQFDDQDWRTLDLPHDWSIEDLGSSDPSDVTVARVRDGQWLFHPGDNPAWSRPSLAESTWQSVVLPAAWKDHSHYNKGKAYGWYRRHVDISAAALGKDLALDLGIVMGADETFFNGVRVGGVGQFPPQFEDYWSNVYQTQRTYRVPAHLVKAHDNVVAVRVYSETAGRGGIYDFVPTETASRQGPFDTSASMGGNFTGFTVGGIGWYRKTFALAAEDRGKLVSLRFDGAYMNSDVWINGHHLGFHPYGYTTFSYDLTPFLKAAGEANVVAVRIANIGANSRWYSGSGIYRHTWLTVTDPVHIPLWGVHVTTPTVDTNQARVNIATAVDNNLSQATRVRVHVRLLSEAGANLGDSEEDLAIDAHGKGEVAQDITLEHPHLWSPATPQLYQTEVTLTRDGRMLDSTRTTFGVRTVSVDAVHGFRLNGESLKLRGGCLHHDNGPLGAKAIDRAEIRRVELLKANGFNAIRTSHNPPSPALLEAADRLGMLVLDEAFDQWEDGKNPDDYHKYFKNWWQRDLEAMVLRDRNHPSVIMWSIGNEIPERDTDRGAADAKMLADAIRRMDSSRPITSAVNKVNEKADAYFSALDVAGYNYMPENYAADHLRHPQRVMLATESYPFQLFKYWKEVEDKPWVIGDFVWTAFDYIGESGIGHANRDNELQSYLKPWPWHIANCGDINICGLKNPQSYYRDVIWAQSPLQMAVHKPLPADRHEVLGYWGWPDEERHWTWPGLEGKPLEVHVYSRYPQVRLFLNGHLIGTQNVGPDTELTATFAVPYVPGELRAVGVVDGKEQMDQAVTFHTAGRAVSLRLVADRQDITASRDDLSYVTVEAVDAAGQRVPTRSNLVQLQVSGEGQLAGVCNSNPVDPSSFTQPQRHLYQGHASVVLRPYGSEGAMTLLAQAQGLKPALLTVRIGAGRPAAQRLLRPLARTARNGHSRL